MAKRLTQALGVDIGTQSIKIAGVKLGADGPAITSLGLSPTIEGTLDHSGISQPAPLTAALKEAAAMHGGGIKDVVFCINGQSAVLVRVLEVPRMSESELQQHMGWEIQRNIPFAESTVVSDYRPVDNPALAASQNMEVVMAVSPQSAIDTVLAICKGAGLKVGAIDVEPLGIGRVLHTCHAHDAGSKNVCVVHIGHSTTAINMYRQGMLAFPRTVLMGGSLLTRAIADALNIPAYEAEEKKRKEAAVSESAGQVSPFGQQTVQADFQPYNPFDQSQAADPGQTQAMPAAPAAQPSVPASADARITNAILPQIEEFVAELRRSVDYHRGRGGQVDEIVLSGGGANLVGFDRYVERSLGIPVSKINPFNNLSVSVGSDEEDLVKNHASEFAVAVGMGLHIAYD
jgi:type IV pilus assembly protein PilM